ncbi:MAG: hypothetical protein GYB67_14650 [Chloroflexi bacterium]|nr:hypothetical protein [Chloroflexota bacterium]
MNLLRPRRRATSSSNGDAPVPSQSAERALATVPEPTITVPEPPDAPTDAVIDIAATDEGVQGAFTDAQAHAYLGLLFALLLTVGALISGGLALYTGLAQGRYLVGPALGAAAIFQAGLAVWIFSTPSVRAARLQMSARAWIGARLGLAVIGTALAAVTYAAAVDAEFDPVLIGAWVGATLCWWLALTPTPPDPGALLRRIALRPPEKIVITLHWDGIAVALLIGLAALALTTNLDWMPDEMNDDHGENAADVARIVRGNTDLYFANNNGREPAHFYLAGLISAAGASSYFLSLKLASAIAALLTLPALYILGRQIDGRLTGVLVLGFGAVCIWYLIMGRMGFRVIFGALATAWLLVALLHALNTGERWAFLLTGLILGLGQFGYVAFRIAPLVVIAGLGIFWLARRGADRRRLFFDGAAAGILSIIVFMPLLSYWINYPNLFWYRATTMFGDTGVAPLTAIGEAFVDSLLMFNVGLDPILYNLPALGAPILTPITGVLFVVGLLWLIWRVIRHRDLLALFLLAAFVILLLPSPLGASRPIETPSARRVIATYPLVMLLAGIVLARPLRGLWHIGYDWSRGLALLLGAAVLITSITLDLATYFNTYSENYRAGPNRLAAEVITVTEIGPQNAYIVFLGGRSLNGQWVGLWLDEPQWHVSHVIGESAAANCAINATDRRVLFILNGDDAVNANHLLACYPGSIARTYTSERRETLLLVITPG